MWRITSGEGISSFRMGSRVIQVTFRVVFTKDIAYNMIVELLVLCHLLSAGDCRDEGEMLVKMCYGLGLRWSECGIVHELGPSGN